MPSVADPADLPAFLAGGGDLGARIARHDWSGTALGPIDGWPLALRQTVSLMLRSPVPIVLLWGEQGVMLYNDAYVPVAGGREGRLLGSNVRSGWDEVAAFNDHVMRVCLAGGSLSYADRAFTLYRDGHAEQVWMNLDYSPVLGDDGRPAGVLGIVSETTREKRALAALQQSERRLRFLDELGRAVVDCRDAAQVLATTTRLTAQLLGVSSCAYADMDDDEDGFTIRGDWCAEGSPSIVGRHRLVDFGVRAVEDLHAGRPLIINDNRVELAPTEARTFQRLGLVSTVCMPLLRQGKLIALMAVHDRDAHSWSDDELTLIREVTERSWAHVQRVGAEGVLREREAHHRQILDGAIDYAIIATDVGGRIALWNSGATRMLGWTESEMLKQPLERIYLPADRDAEQLAAQRIAAANSGHIHDARWLLHKAGHRFWGVSEFSPLHDGRGALAGYVAVIRDETEAQHARQALQSSEDQLRRAQAAGGIGLFSIDVDSDRIATTPAFCRIFGFDPDQEIVASMIESLVLAEDRNHMSDRGRRQDGTAPLDVEYRVRRADTGDERVIARTAEYERDESGRVVRLVGVVQDVTERRRIQRALAQSEARFGALAENLPNMVWTARADGHLDWFNEPACRYFGCTSSALTRAGWWEQIHPDERAAAVDRWQQSVAQGTVYEADFRLCDAAGRYRWHLTRAVPLSDEQWQIIAWVGTSTDIEAQKQAEAAHAEDRNRLWNASQDLMLVCDFGGVITAVNPSAQRLLGWQAHEMIGRRIDSFLHPDDIASTQGELDNLEAGTTTLAFENRWHTSDDGYVLLAWTAVPDKGRVHAIGRDITAQRSIEETLRQSQKMEAVGQLTGGIAHDFNNLLQGISGSLSLMEKRLAQGRTGDLQRWIDAAQSSADRAAGLTHRLLAFSRRQPLDPRPVSVNPLIGSMEDLLRRSLGEHVDLRLMLGSDAELWMTRCDPNQLEAALLNLAINARDAMPDGGLLTLETENVRFRELAIARELEIQLGEYVCIRVRDTGVGMDRPTQLRAFEPFFTTKPTGQGTGLGLSMVYGFTRQSEGQAHIASAPGAGTTVSLYLPRHVGETPAHPAPSAARGETTHPGSGIVLVVDDEPLVRGLIVEVLASLGFDAIEAGDGVRALEILQSPQPVDLLVTDIGLPGLNGRQVADAARVGRPGLKVLFITGYAENAAASAGFLEPGMALITKPFDLDVMATRIREMLAS